MSRYRPEHRRANDAWGLVLVVIVLAPWAVVIVLAGAAGAIVAGIGWGLAVAYVVGLAAYDQRRTRRLRHVPEPSSNVTTRTGSGTAT